MSKSLKNVIDPDYLIKTYGADTARIFCLFAAPPEKRFGMERSGRGRLLPLPEPSVAHL